MWAPIWWLCYTCSSFSTLNILLQLLNYIIHVLHLGIWYQIKALDNIFHIKF